MVPSETIPGYDGTGWALAETNVGQWALYAQDEILIGNDFKLTLGIRMDMPLYFDTQEKIRENINRKPAGKAFQHGCVPDRFVDGGLQIHWRD